jgi:hypothetical protein
MSAPMIAIIDNDKSQTSLSNDVPKYIDDNITVNIEKHALNN